MQHSFMNNSICSNHEECEACPSQIKLKKGFITKEFVKGHSASSFIHKLKCIVFIESNIISFYNKEAAGYCSLMGFCNEQVNAVRGLRLYEDIFSESQLCKLGDFVKEIHAAGQNGELSGEFCRFNVGIGDL